MPSIWTYLYRNDGTVISSTTCEWSPGGKWSWIARSYAEDFGCTPDEVSVLETDDGDLITVRDEPVGWTVDEIKGAKIERLMAAE